MIDMHLRYDNMHNNEMFYVLICINNHIIFMYELHVITRERENKIEIKRIDLERTRERSKEEKKKSYSPLPSPL